MVPDESKLKLVFINALKNYKNFVQTRT